MIKQAATISNKLGLHARASAKLTKLAGSFACDVHLSRNGRRVDAAEASALPAAGKRERGFIP